MAYSAKKNKVNPAPPYSILNPDTSSLSPSDRSNGARFVSARMIIRNRRELINKNLRIYILEEDRVRFLRRDKGGKILRNKITSYLTDWLKDRYPPTRAYALLEAHPARVLGKTPIEIRNKKRVRVRKVFPPKK